MALQLCYHRPMHRSAIVFLALLTHTATAGPAIQAGDMALRHDIQRLADYGVISGPVSTWPLAWGPIFEDIGNADASRLPPAIADALARLKQRADWELRLDELTYRASASVAEEPTRIRSFQNNPRETAEISLGLSYTSDWFAISLNGQAVDSPADGGQPGDRCRSG